ncbi:MAG: RluA family pseudouridine synthase [Gammaproteobacteria bacterium]|nr:MAG: RluA family pseudouridine synthase [Gammaproteobacteria bacterium]
MSLNYSVLDSDEGLRVDLVAAKQFSDYSRGHIQKWIKNGDLLVNNQEVKTKHSLQLNDVISVDFWEEPQLGDQPETIPLDIIFEDEEIMIINKSVGMVVHPGSGNPDGTLVNALLAHEESLGFLPRAGIVHRLDKDTSGLMVVAKKEAAYLNLIEQLKERSVKRTYMAIVVGVPISNKIINEPIGRHPKIRTKQAVVKNGKEAITRVSLSESFQGYSLLRVNLETGRTHQIRVHLSHAGYPIVGDSVYGARKQFAPGSTEGLKNIISSFTRQALHASELELIHPSSEKLVSFEADLPEDMSTLIGQLKD